MLTLLVAQYFSSWGSLNTAIMSSVDSVVVIRVAIRNKEYQDCRFRLREEWRDQRYEFWKESSYISAI